MVLSSIGFLYLFSQNFLTFHANPTRWKNLFLGRTSILFYVWGEPHLVILMLLSVAPNFR